MSKQCKLELNSYYHKKKMEKNFLIQRYVKKNIEQPRNQPLQEPV
eukprot:CAMPEP_0202962230 /NCGR_PEP_ID=MMETSP1396-20130829/6329_1 /ASSEMBLY_ACC=CAM_ASM_000872 /TAXON_ID= /ORGANISM="Pseudokeronopsis sp., Strain Brazil" /LENGTH=44 /DNA_ID= /DNA_START= /DNA_END= /DNA_ORIENTATION=